MDRQHEVVQRDAKAGGGAPSEDYCREERKAAALGSLALALVLVAIFLMVAKPGL